MNTGPGTLYEVVVLLSSQRCVSIFQEEEMRNFQMQMQQRHRPSCVALEKDLRQTNLALKYNDSALGKVTDPIPLSAGTGF